MKSCKKLLSFILAGIMIFALVACGKTGGNSGNSTGDNQQTENDTKEENKDDNKGGFLSDLFDKDDKDNGNKGSASTKDYVYKEVSLDYLNGKDAKDYSFLAQVGDMTYFMYYRYDETNCISTNSIVGINLTNGTKKEIKLDTGNNEYYYSYCFDKNSNMYAIKNQYEYNENTGESTDDYFVAAFNKNGSAMWEEPLKMEDDWLQTMFCLDDGSLVLIYSTRMMKMDVNTKQTTKIMDIPSEYSFESIFQLDDGRMLAIAYQEGRVLVEVNMEDGTVSAPVKIPGTSYNFSFSKGRGYDLFAYDSVGIYGYNFGATEMVKIMDMVDSDIDTYSFNSVTSLGENEFIVSYNALPDYDTVITKLVKVDPKDIKDKTIVTIAGTWIPTEIKSDAIRFNKTSEDVRFKLIDYSTYNTDDDYDAGSAKLNTDIISGNTPDILIASDDLPLASYSSKGLFLDLNSYLNDTFQREDYMTNIFDVYSSDGKLYQLPISFNVTTLAAKKSIVGDKSTWTLEEMTGIVKKYDEMNSFEDKTIRDQVMNYAMQFSFNQFIDLNTGKCNFNSPEFIALLEFIKTFPAEFDYDNFDYDSYDYSSIYRKNKALLCYLYLGDFQSYNYAKKGTFGEDITLIGFPCALGNGSSCDSYNRLTILAKSKNKDIAWNFISGYLKPEYQDTVKDNWGGWPVLKSSIDKMGELAKEGNFWTDENNVKQYYDDTYYINDEEIVLEKITDEEIQTVKDFLGTINKRSYYDSSVSDIINEEAAAFFSGQKSSADVAQVIQSRVQIYVNENR